jgi:hypothetical protein
VPAQLTKAKLKLVSDLLNNIQVLADADPERVLKFFIQVSGVYDLKLVTDLEFTCLLVDRTSGRIMQMLGAYLSTTSSWGEVRASIISTFLPLRLMEGFLRTYVLDRFQSSSEDLNTYIMSVVAAADILGFSGSECQLVHRMLQNLHPRTRSQLLFVKEPQSIQDLYALTTTVAEAVAVEEQRKRSLSSAPPAEASRPRGNEMRGNSPSPAMAGVRAACWRCGRTGHLQRNCRQEVPADSNPARPGNARGARR